MKKLITVVILLLIAIAPATAQPEIPSLLNELKSKPADTGKVILYGRVATAYEFKNADSAMFYIHKGLELARKIKSEVGEGRLLQQTGIFYFRHGELDTAEMYFKQAMAIFQKNTYRKGIALCYNSMGVIQGQRGNYSLAVKDFLSALKIFKEDKDEQGEMETYIKLGLANELSKNVNEALKYYTQAKTICDKYPPSKMTITLLNNLGILYGKKGDYHKALEYFEEGIKLSKNIEFSTVHIGLTTDAGNAYSRLGDKKRALKNYQESYKNAVKYNLPEEEAHALVNMASNLDSANWAQGIPYLKRAMEIAKNIKQDGLLTDVYHAISEVYAVGGMFKEAYGNAVIYHNMSDSIMSVQRSSEIAEMQAKFDLGISENKIQQLEITNQKTTMQRNMVIVAIAAICIIICILFFYYTRVSKLNRKLRASNHVKDKLFSVIGHDLRSPIGGIVQTLELLDSNMLTKEESREVIKELKSRGEGAYEILNSMLLWGKAQLQGTNITMVSFDPKSHIEKTIQSLTKQAQDKNIDIRNTIQGELTLNADADHFDFILRNLISNAIKFSYESSTIEIGARATNDKVIFSVSDQGIGISPAAQQDFIHTNLEVTYGTKGEKGTGIGLLMIKEYVVANGGRLWFESVEGKGTTFYFSLTGNITAVSASVTSQASVG